jgi:hypothetical protein
MNQIEELASMKVFGMKVGKFLNQKSKAVRILKKGDSPSNSKVVKCYNLKNNG